MYNKCNKNGDNSLNWKEWYKCFKKECGEDCEDMNKRKLRRYAREVMMDYDENENRRLEWEEFEELCEDYMEDN